MRKIFALTAMAFACAPAARADAPASHPYQVFATSVTCQYQGDCAVFFPAIANAGNTIIQHLSCEFALTGGSVVGAVLSGPTNNVRNIVPVFAFAAANGVTTYGINADTYLFFAKGVVPEVDVYSAGAPIQDLNCTVSGYY